MNNTDKIIALSQAGFTRDEILKIIQASEPSQSQAQSPVNAPVQNQYNPVLPPSAGINQQYVQPNNGQSDMLAQVLQRMDDMQKTIQSQNTINTATYKPPETSDDILRSLINPAPEVDNNILGGLLNGK